MCVIFAPAAQEWSFAQKEFTMIYATVSWDWTLTLNSSPLEEGQRKIKEYGGIALDSPLRLHKYASQMRLVKMQGKEFIGKDYTLDQAVIDYNNCIQYSGSAQILELRAQHVQKMDEKYKEYSDKRDTAKK